MVKNKKKGLNFEIWLETPKKFVPDLLACIPLKHRVRMAFTPSFTNSSGLL